MESPGFGRDFSRFGRVCDFRIAFIGIRMTRAVAVLFHVKQHSRRRRDAAVGTLDEGDDLASGKAVSGEVAEGVHSPTPPAATGVFGDRLNLAQDYRDILATEGIVQGLIGPREVDRLWTRHVLNCAVIGEVIAPGSTVIDIGSGAGLPGIPLAIARPDLSVTLVEPLLRRSTFLDSVIARLGLDGVRVVRGRAEEKSVRAEIGTADVVTSRAVAPLERLAGWSAPLVASGGVMVAIKGSSAAEEIERDKAVVEKRGLTRLRVVTCGTRFLDDPTTVVVGDKVANNLPDRRRGTKSHGTRATKRPRQ